jgi:hypothetical protein
MVILLKKDSLFIPGSINPVRKQKWVRTLGFFAKVATEIIIWALANPILQTACLVIATGITCKLDKKTLSEGIPSLSVFLVPGKLARTSEWSTERRALRTYEARISCLDVGQTIRREYMEIGRELGSIRYGGGNH